MSGSFPRMDHCEFLEIDIDDLDTSNLNAHVVGDHARRRMLQDRHPWIGNTSSIDADMLLHNLSQLAPSVAKDFMPKRNAVEGLVFRLINSEDYGAVEETSFVALSYAWKNGELLSPRTTVSPLGDLPFGWIKTVEEFPLPTTPAMFQAVLRERQNGSEGLWYDQVCINQEDGQEKAAAIGAIDTIYGNARAAIIALNDVLVEEDEVAYLQQYFRYYANSDLPSDQQPNHGLDPPFMQTQPLFSSFLNRILASNWFKRAWCGLEMRLARGHVFLVPCATRLDDDGYLFIRFTGDFFLHMLTLSMEVPRVDPGEQKRIASLQQLFSRRVKMQEREFVLARSPLTPVTPFIEPISYITTIAEVFKQKAGGNARLVEYLRRLDANRDKACIALNASGLPLALKPRSSFQRPSIEDECLRQLLLVGLAAQDPTSLCTTGPPLQLHDGSISWLSRPTTVDIMTPSRVPPPFNPPTIPITQASDGRAEYIQLGLFFLDLPHRAAPTPNFAAHIQKARMVIDMCIQAGISSAHPTWTSWQTPAPHTRAPSMKNIFIQTLGCAFECGPTWLHDLSTRYAAQMQSQSQPLSREVIDALCNPRFQIQASLTVPAGRHALTILLDIMSILITHGVPWASGSTERSHGPMVVTLPNLAPSTGGSTPTSASPSYTHPSQSHSHPASSASPSQHLSPPPPKAIIFAPFAFSKQLLIAVPEATKAKEYPELSRGWILTSLNPYTGTGSQAGGVVNWTLQSKTVVFGEMSFDAGLEGTSVAAGVPVQRVFGPARVGGA
ncbi:heterokaryon incompatibility protein-domain-containing protein [Clohesyomyces aquaticus]|uniref:Heterokaryon incompatibility protein-domain-containing protein n=1 Tax=Clohesyomyces aquaticus TaxID=1231657 RepID=A0A1Y1YGJ8_9PLEO|nr:heterokaryon incompatibility protein-domain-containing protein [Clohesyomyces aquaticus]